MTVKNHKNHTQFCCVTNLFIAAVVAVGRISVRQVAILASMTTPHPPAQQHQAAPCLVVYLSCFYLICVTNDKEVLPENPPPLQDKMIQFSTDGGVVLMEKFQSQAGKQESSNSLSLKVRCMAWPLVPFYFHACAMKLCFVLYGITRPNV